MFAKEKYLVDTNIFGLALKLNKNKESIHPKAATFVNQLNAENLILSRFVFSELAVGAGFVPAVAQKLRELARHELLECDKAHMDSYIEFKTKLNKQNINNKTIDWLLAAQAIVEDCTLVTANIKDFEQIPNLKTKFYEVENHRWRKS